MKKKPGKECGSEALCMILNFVGYSIGNGIGGAIIYIHIYDVLYIPVYIYYKIVYYIKQKNDKSNSSRSLLCPPLSLSLSPIIFILFFYYFLHTSTLEA